MIVLISPAKTFADPGKIKSPIEMTMPRYREYARKIALAASGLKPEDIARSMEVNSKIAGKAYLHWQSFLNPSEPCAPAALLYSGMVFKKLDAATFSSDTWSYAADHLRITSFAYGMLAPADGIVPYRMEGNVELPVPVSGKVFDYWRPLMTDIFIAEIQRTGGVLCYLASEEMKQLFDWKRVEKSVRVITPLFMVPQAGGKLKQIVIYTKMARGLMARHILQHRITDPEQLKGFSPNGFVYSDGDSGVRTSADEWIYILSE